MKYALILVILLVCAGAYYDHALQQQAIQDVKAADQKQIADLTSQVGKLHADSKKLADDNADLTKSLADTKTNLAAVTTQLLAAQKQIDDAKKQDVAEASKPPPPPPPISPNDLGTIVALDGKTYQKCELLKIDTDGITVNHSAGVLKLLYGLLPLDLQKKFGYDPHVTTSLTEDQVLNLENQRKAAVQKFGY